jgi:hypothetical protein
VRYEANNTRMIFQDNGRKSLVKSGVITSIRISSSNGCIL